MAIRTSRANAPVGRRPVSGPGALSGREKSDLPLIASSDWTGLIPLYTGFCGTYYDLDVVYL